VLFTYIYEGENHSNNSADFAMTHKRKQEDESPRILLAGRPDHERCDNKISTSKYSFISFLPVATLEQFRRVANLYFLIIGSIMAIGYYSTAFESAISPWTTLGPLCFVISVSLLQEGLADLNRHKSDDVTNNSHCVILNRSDNLDHEGGTREPSILKGKDLHVSLERAYSLASPRGGDQSAAVSVPGKSCDVAFQQIKRMDIRQGHLVLIRNRDMVPADLILMASSSDNGSAYIETSSIDGETNLKLRTSPHLPEKEGVKSARIIAEERGAPHLLRETLEEATKRITRFSTLAYPHGKSALENAANPVEDRDAEVHEPPASSSGLHLIDRGISMAKRVKDGAKAGIGAAHDLLAHAPEQLQEALSTEIKYVAALTSEPPNASVNTFSGSFTLPPIQVGGPSIIVPLNSENILLRGAVLRNTEWAIGLACFTGTDTKLVRNSFETPSKFSQLDRLMNQTVLFIVIIMIICISYLATLSTITANNEFDKLWYIGFNKNDTEKWPYLPDTLEAPTWTDKPSKWIQVFFLFVTLLNNFVPLSLYVTVEIITAVLRYFINLDIEMYHARTDTRTVARSTTVTDLGQVQYVFSDKTGTLTQNVMVFKRCSVDGNVFGAPVVKATPDSDEGEIPFHPLKRLLTGKLSFNGSRATDIAGRQPSSGLEGLGDATDVDEFEGGTITESQTLTFNAEMFLRVMSICHTVVVEKDFDANTQGIIGSVKSSPSGSGSSKGVFQTVKDTASLLFKGKKSLKHSESSLPEGTTADNRTDLAVDIEGMEQGSNRARANTTASVVDPSIKNKDGAPGGFAYQAESPDEGALVQVSSLKFDFQLVGRDSSGLQLLCKSASLLQDPNVVKGLKSGSLTLKAIAADTGSPNGDSIIGRQIPKDQGERLEIWKILAVNKFDSTRKRMSCLVRSPPELGGIPMLLCKGADTAMLDPDICVGGMHLMSGDEDRETILKASHDVPRPPRPATNSLGGRGVSIGGLVQEQEEDWEKSSLLGIQSHLGIFAREGLRTLVLGVRFLTDDECQTWLEEYNKAAASIKDRDTKLTAAAQKIECKLHIVGASAIEDKLQDGVPETIKKLGQAGIKLWVLTGDKRETAKEIGYATQVLTERMRPGLIEVCTAPKNDVRTKMCMEFLKLVKYAKIPEYQKAAVGADDSGKWIEKLLFKFGKCRRSFSRAIRRFFYKYVFVIFQYCFSEVSSDDPTLKGIDEETTKEVDILRVSERRRGVRERAEMIVREYLNSDNYVAFKEAATISKRNKNAEVALSDEELSMLTADERDVFSRSRSAQEVLDQRRAEGKISATELRSLTMANVTAHDIISGEAPLVDEEILSMQSFRPTDGDSGKADYSKAKRTILERVFAVDSATRHGRLAKHLYSDKLKTVTAGKPLRPKKADEEEIVRVGIDGPRALVIEGAALDQLLGDTQLEEILFAVASSCDSVIACRVSPAQKAQLVQLVRRYVVPEPVTLAIGDGANDVGMIQEAHVGVGISGKEGQQAVNSSDFAIAQFKYLETLLLIHGRWDFMRQSTVVLFSFYKNALMAGCLIIYSGRNLYSGTPLFDEWAIASLNFVAGVPIAALGFWDRCLDKDYVRSHPEVYGTTRRNELITNRIRLRWVALVFVHVFTLYYFTVPALATGGAGSSSAFLGLMRNKEPGSPGNGEGGDLQSVGLVTFSCLIMLLAYKVSYETKSIITGKWPAIRLRKDPTGETWIDRVSYTWVGTAYFSVGFYLFFIYVYNYLGTGGPSSFSYFVYTTWHVLHTRSISWMLIMFVPIAGMVFDVTGKVFSNLFYPTQTQIHLEIFAKQGTVYREAYSASGKPDVADAGLA